MYDIPADSVVSVQPIFKCSPTRLCDQAAEVDTSLAMWNDTGKCSALLTREGFFDFVVFSTHCNVSHKVSVVCQHDRDANVLMHNNMSDVKVSTSGGIYSLQMFSRCDVGWFLVDNVCISFYHCPLCFDNTAANRQCETHGGQLAYHVLNNVTSSTKGNTLEKNTELSLFWRMFHHMEDINPPPWKTFKSFENIIHPWSEKYFAVNGSDLCVAFNMSTQCLGGDIVLSVSYTDIRLEEYVYDISTGGFQSISLVRINNTDYYTPLWSVIHQPMFKIAKYKHCTMCEKPSTHSLVFTNCSDFYMSCNDGTCVHDSLVCDGRPHCLDGEDEADCQHICSDHEHSCMSQCHHRDLCTCSQEYFQCLSGGCVPLQKLCDKTVHCIDASDEPATCVYLQPENLGRSSLLLGINNYINKLIQQNMVIQQRCLQSINESFLHVQNVEYKMYFHQQRCSASSVSSDIRFLCTIIGTPHIASQHYFSFDRLCIYDHDCDDSYIYQCFNGFHLLKCEHMYCVGRFKCPSSYCISFDHICNKVCDCLHCEDEMICSKLLCPGMVLLEHMGSGLRCSAKFTTLKHSMNRRQVIQRKEVDIIDDFPVFVHLEGVVNLTRYIRTPEVVVYCEILHSKFTMAGVLYRMVSVRRLVLPHNNIQNIHDFIFPSMSQLILLDLSHNLIRYLPGITLCILRGLQYISLHHNLIAELQFSIFVNNPRLQVLLLDSNKLNPQSVLIGDASLPSLYRLSSDIPRLCCAFDTVALCSPPFPLLVSCSNLITSTPLIILGWIIGLSTTFLCLFCVALLVYKLSTPTNQTLRVVILFSLNLILAELVTSFCLLSYSVINVVYYEVFGIIADQWRHSWKCLGLETLFSMSSLATLAFTVCLSVHFAIHIPSVIQRVPSQKATFFQILILWCIIASTCITIEVLEHMRNADPFNYFCFPFTTVLPSDLLALGLKIIILILDVFLIMATIASYGYLVAFTIRRTRSKTLQSVDNRKVKLMKLGARSTVLILSTVLTWIPILCVQTLVLLQITVMPILSYWCILVGFAINLVIDPILLIRNMLA